MDACQSDVIRALEKARGALLQASQQAAQRGRWPFARKLVELAERVDGIRVEAETQGPASNHRQAQMFALVAPSLASLDAVQAERARKHAEYPIYIVNDGMLVKRGLQRDGLNFYEHAVPREACSAIIRQIQAKTHETDGKARPFTIDDLQHDLTCPRYMTYVVASLLLRHGLMTRTGKGKYIVESPATLVEDVTKLLEEIQRS
jgi:hypothetical protein